MKLLCICQPKDYVRPESEIPIFYRKLALDSTIELFHLPLTQVIDRQSSNNDIVSVAKVEGNLSYEDFLALDKQAKHNYSISEFALAFCRTLKPFPPGYLEQLSSWEKIIPFVNCPSGIQRQIEPDFFPLVAQDFIPETIVTSDIDRAAEFLVSQHIIVAKRSNSCGGKGVFKIWQQGQQFYVDNLQQGITCFNEFAQVMNYVQNSNSEAMQLMRYLPGVDHGDKRVIVVEGKIYGAFIRRSQTGYWVNNVSGDGKCELAAISPREVEAIKATEPYYRSLGLHTLGYDFLMDETGDWRISEINAGNIGGFARLEELGEQDIYPQFITWLRKFAQTKASLTATFKTVE